ncbi:MAG: hypothetical protein A2W01_01020 [Candidatus Solincola sediminis]|nr:MAG: hypothetical protein A2W01_01020 [Candidatus Solincola sediminis]
MFKKISPRIFVLTLCLMSAAVSALLFIDPWGWFNTAGAVGVSTDAFPGVEVPALYPSPQPLSDGSFNVLILGIDHGLGRPAEGNNRSDVIMVAHVDEKRYKACLLSIPRDSYVEIPGHGRAKINEAYSLGGATLALATVSQLTGMEIRNYVALDFDEFKKLVDLFGGFQITLDQPVLDPKVGAIPAGNVFLNGEQALILARSRNYPNADLSRVRQQQRILTQILYKGKELAAYPGAAWFLSTAKGSVETDFTLDELIRLCREFASFPVVDVQGGVAPGKVGTAGAASVILVDQQGLQRLVQSIQASSIVPDEFR